MSFVIFSSQNNKLQTSKIHADLPSIFRDVLGKIPLKTATGPVNIFRANMHDFFWTSLQGVTLGNYKAQLKIYII